MLVDEPQISGSLWLDSGSASDGAEHRWLWQGLSSDVESPLLVDGPGQWNEALDTIRTDLVETPGAAGVPRWVGLISYEAGSLVEPAVGYAGHPDVMPLAMFWRHNGSSQELSTEEGALPAAAAFPSPSVADHERRIEDVRARIGVGEIYQANLARRIDLSFDEPVKGLQLARHLQHREQHCYSAWLRVGPELAIVSLTPECLLRGTFGKPEVWSYPIKGTAEPQADGLLGDPKERAEHVMIVDLVRNDLGRVARVGSVHVDPLLGTRDMRTLRHLESRICAELAPGYDVFDALNALLPGGSITGAPKIQATRVIADLEKRPRGPYTGALLTVDAAGQVVVSLLIRTLVLQGSQGWLDVGGGIVWASDARQEVQETRRKALAHLDGMVSEIP
ncbi:MAG: hypothetical protein CMH54_00130 [Myxococcales bacterium]|nr:hypothetical protein [Myxococcales bacterium]